MKYRGNIIVSYELLKEALKLPKSVDITNVYVSSKDRERDTITISLISSDENFEYTFKTGEADIISEELFDNYLINNK